MNLLMIARSNIRKNKRMTVTLIILILFATILLYISTSVMLEMNTFLDNRNKELNGSAFTVLAPKQYEETSEKLVVEMGGYEEIEKENAIYFHSTFRNPRLEEKGQPIDCYFLNGDQTEIISKLNIIDEGEGKVANSIVLPYYLKVTKGYRTGDTISVANGDKTFDFVIYGFAEDIMFAIPSNISCYKCYVFGEQFQQLYEEKEDFKYFLLKTTMPEGSDTVLYADSFIKELNNKVTDSTSLIYVLDYDAMKVGVGTFFTILMVFVILFSAIIILIALTVIRFAVVSYIEGNIQNIGSMEALGYTGRELVGSTVLQFILITVAGVVLGFIVASSCAGIVTNLVSSSIGLAWNTKVNIIAILIVITIILGLVILIAYLTAAKIKRITPITALRSGIDTHNFKKNYFPLHKNRLNINVQLGLKTLMHNMKQNITVLIITTLMSFVAVFAFMANYNMIIDNSAMLQLLGIERSHLVVNYIGKDSTQVFDDIGQMNHVRKTIRMTRASMTFSYGDKETTPSVSICNDYELLEINSIVRGRYPVHENEIAVTSLVLRQLGARMGDSIAVHGSSTQEEYMIVGVTQQINNLGKGACITEEGMKRISPEYIPSDLYIYLDDGELITDVKNAIDENYSDTQLSVRNMEEEVDTILTTFNYAITGLCYGIIIITLFIIAIILYLIIKIKLLKEKVRIGVSKSLGYTTKQLILQITFSFLPVCLLGAFLGTVLATILLNPMLASMLSIAGSIDNCHFTIEPMLTFLTFLAFSGYAALITALVARSVRKITPCELFQ